MKNAERVGSLLRDKCCVFASNCANQRFAGLGVRRRGLHKSEHAGNGGIFGAACVLCLRDATRLSNQGKAGQLPAFLLPQWVLKGIRAPYRACVQANCPLQ